MSAAELEMVNSMLRAIPKEGPTDDWPKARANMEAALEALPPVEGVSTTALKIGDMAAEWSQTADASQDRVLLYLHGGGYCAGSLKTHRTLVAQIAKSFKGRVLAIDYRLGPENKYPAAIDDAVAAYQFLLKEGIKPSHIAIAGDSAGGGLTVATLLALRDKKIALPAAAWPISPWVDLEGRGASLKSKAESDLIVTADGLHNYAKAYAGARRGEGLASPVNASLAGLPPLLIQVGSAEVLLDDSITLAQKAAAADVEVKLEVWPHMPHVWHIFSGFLTEGHDAIGNATAWLNARVGQSK
ncbi:MAG: alpha/beta hydrolase fold domain-containing protein [Alphaproteobacteria bacterium]|nr:alpha/beta hydrolase fold domain-containing protein [Alphaproteobacteria bacterium]